MWPFNARAAVSICYDDGHFSNLNTVIPVLEDRAFRGTFYLTKVFAEADALGWRAACRSGHEIGNHSWDHDLALLHDGRIEEFAQRLGDTEQWLNENIGLNGVPGVADDLRSYAYIEGDLLTGESAQHYLEKVKTLFWFARAGGGGPTSVAEVLTAPFYIPAQALTWGRDSYEVVVDYIEQAAENGGWAIPIFHQIVEGTPAGKIETSQFVHTRVLDYLKTNESRFWIAPMRDVYRHIRSEVISK